MPFTSWLKAMRGDSVNGEPNTLDMLVTEGGRSLVRHHLIDFGSTLGSGTTQAQSTRAGNEYIWEARPTLVTMLTLGFYVRPWVKVDYPDYPALGRFEANYFLPQAWKPEYPNPAFQNARAEYVEVLLAQRDMLDTVNHSVQKMKLLLQKLSRSESPEHLVPLAIDKVRGALTSLPEGFTPHPKLKPVLAKRAAMAEGTVLIRVTGRGLSLMAGARPAAAREAPAEARPRLAGGTSMSPAHARSGHACPRRG